MPEAILLQDVEELGERGKVVDVSKGYLRNFLVPRKLAAPATKGAVEAPRRRQEAAERAEREQVERAQDNANLLNRTVLTITQQAGDDGRLFGSVTAQDIADAVRDARGLKIDKRKVHLEEPIRNVGTYMVVVEVADEVTATVKTMVVAKCGRGLSRPPGAGLPMLMMVAKNNEAVKVASRPHRLGTGSLGNMRS